MEHSVSHKGHWCIVVEDVFCQEYDCENCEIYVRYRDISHNNGLPSGDIGLHSIPDKKKQQKELSGRQKCQP